MRSVRSQQSTFTKVYQPLNPGVVDYTMDTQQTINGSTRNSRKVEGTTSRLDSFFKSHQRIATFLKPACNFDFAIFPANKPIWALSSKFPFERFAFPMDFENQLRYAHGYEDTHAHPEPAIV